MNPWRLRVLPSGVSMTLKWGCAHLRPSNGAVPMVIAATSLITRRPMTTTSTPLSLEVDSPPSTSRP